MEHAVDVAIADEVVARFPEVLVGGFVAVELQSLRAGSWPRTEHVPVVGDLVEHGNIRAWRKAIGACGLKPSRYKSSAEQLARRYLKGERIDSGIPAVDLYCDVGARHVSPFGAYDLDRLPVPRIELRTPRPGDTFTPLGSRGDDMPLTEEVVVYGSGDRVICWAWNHRDAADTALHAGSAAAAFLGEAAYGEQHASLRAALEDLAATLRAAGVVVGATAFADAELPTMRLEC